MKKDLTMVASHRADSPPGEDDKCQALLLIPPSLPPPSSLRGEEEEVRQRENYGFAFTEFVSWGAWEAKKELIVNIYHVIIYFLHNVLIRNTK